MRKRIVQLFCALALAVAFTPSVASASFAQAESQIVQDFGGFRVSVAAPVTNQVLLFNGTTWVNGTAPAGATSSPLSTVLTNGNATGASDISVNSGQKITSPSSTNLLLAASLGTGGGYVTITGGINGGLYVNVATTNGTLNQGATLLGLNASDSAITNAGSVYNTNVQTTINYTAASKTTAISDFLFQRVETSLPTGTQAFQTFKAGVSGSTFEAQLTNAGTWQCFGNYAGSSTTLFGWTSSSDPTTALDACVYRDAAGVTALGGSTNNRAGSLKLGGTAAANGEFFQIQSVSAQTTLSTSGTSTNTAIVPAGAWVIGVATRITTTITTASNWKVTDNAGTNVFIPVTSTLTAGTTVVGTTFSTSIFYSAANTFTIITTGTPGAGVVRVTIFYVLLSAPTS